MKKKRKKRGKEGKGSSSNYTPLDLHRKSGKVLVPPIMALDKVKLTSWLNTRLPEMLWAALLLEHLGRFQALTIFRRVAEYGYGLRPLDIPLDITLSHIADWPPECRKGFLDVIRRNAEPKRALRPLLLLDDLPGKADWQEALMIEPVPEKDWDLLGRAVSKCLFHQSQEATDCRWARVVFQIALGRMHFPESGRSDAEELLFYPDKGDMRKVRPSVRAAELGLDALTEGSLSPWADGFWGQCLRDTGCIEVIEDSVPAERNLTLTEVAKVYDELREWALSSQETTAVDPKHNQIFGAALFATAIVAELVLSRMRCGVIGRLAIRTLLEVFVTLTYLIDKDDPELWKTYRVYGAGQAKLQFLHLEKLGSKTGAIDPAVLEALANEDQWQEFLNVNIGHWTNSSLRDLAIRSDLKDDYDRLYPWTSSYIHGHWGAIRDSIFQTCYNPLHRLHRIPRHRPRVLESVENAARDLWERIIDLVGRCYPQRDKKAQDGSHSANNNLNSLEESASKS